MHPSLQKSVGLRGQTVAERYQISDVRASDGCLRSCRARDLIASRDVNLLCLLTAAAPCSRALDRYRRDAATLRRVAHSGVLAPMDSGDYAGIFYVAFEIPDGFLLSDALASRKSIDAVALLTGLAAGLRAVHGAGLAHLDIRPSRILITPSGAAKLLTFDMERDVRQVRLTDPASRWAWAAPEHVMGLDAGPPADVYSAAAVVYTAMAGVPPYARSTFADRCLGGPPVLPSGCDGALGEIMRQCLHPDAGSRFQNGAALSEACSLLNRPAPAPPRDRCLESLLVEQPQDPGLVVPVLLSACSVLRGIHEAGKAHRSASPPNIILTASGDAHIQAMDPPPTNATVMVDNPKYAAPELLTARATSGGTAHVLADVYVLGFGAYEILAGRRQFEAQFECLGDDRSHLAWMGWHADASKRLPPLRELAASAPAALCTLIDRMIQKEPAARVKSLEEVEQGLRQLEARLEDTHELNLGALAGNPVRNAPPRHARWPWAIMLLLVLAAVAFLAYQVYGPRGTGPGTLLERARGLLKR